jgi:hypothetical protein
MLPAVVPQTGAKDNFCGVYYITLIWNCKAQREFKNLKKKMQKIQLEAKNNA